MAASSICHSNYWEVLLALLRLLAGTGVRGATAEARVPWDSPEEGGVLAVVGSPPEPALLAPPCLQGMSTAIALCSWVWSNRVSPDIPRCSHRGGEAHLSRFRAVG